MIQMRSKNEKIIASFDSFISLLPQQLINSNQKKIDALKQYFAEKRVLRILERENAFPLIIYPDKIKLKALIKEKKALLEHYKKNKSLWELKLFEARSYHLIHSIKKFSSPLYWKHLTKSLTDANYKLDSKKVKLPVHLVSDPKWQPMIKMFLENPDYRKQLVETVENSVVYKDSKKVAKYADSLKEFREKTAEKKVKELDKKINELNISIQALNEMLDLV